MCIYAVGISGVGEKVGIAALQTHSMLLHCGVAKKVRFI